MFSRPRSAETKSSQVREIAHDALGSCLLSDGSYWRVKIPLPKSKSKASLLEIKASPDLLVRFSAGNLGFTPAYYYYPDSHTVMDVEPDAAAWTYHCPGSIYSKKRSIYRPVAEDGLHRKTYKISITAGGSRNMWGSYRMFYAQTFVIAAFNDMQVTVPADTSLEEVRCLVMLHKEVVAPGHDTDTRAVRSELLAKLQKYNPVVQVPLTPALGQRTETLTDDDLRKILMNHLSGMDDESMMALVRNALSAGDLEPYVDDTVYQGEIVYQPPDPNDEMIAEEMEMDIPTEIKPFAPFSPVQQNDTSFATSLSHVAMGCDILQAPAKDTKDENSPVNSPSSDCSSEPVHSPNPIKSSYPSPPSPAPRKFVPVKKEPLRTSKKGRPKTIIELPKDILPFVANPSPRIGRHKYSK